mmetsp:Transcript_13580/g.17890  ORF Transcript_13580/g.17890 Transcript_13580/m.17890 type:complete len:479 (+) Transcript_13580:164-1600(+)
MAAIGQVVNGRWRIDHRVGKGTFCELYEATNIGDGTKVAVKVETAGMEGSVLKWEHEVLFNIQSLECVPRHFWFGNIGEGGKRQALVMQLFGGEDMSALRHRQRNPRVPIGICCDLTVQMLNCLQALHGLGFLHRDVKPSNFIRESRKSRRFYMIDFGLCKRFMSQSGEMRRERPNADFRGTSMYASLNAHRGKDQSRRDDLCSLVYVFLDLFLGRLPWADQAKRKERERVGQIKQQFLDTPATFGAPEITVPLANLMKYLLQLGFTDTPDYNILRNQFQELSKFSETNSEAEFDWWTPEPIVLGGKLIRPRQGQVQMSSEQRKEDKVDSTLSEKEENLDDVSEEAPEDRIRQQLLDLQSQKNLSSLEVATKWSTVAQEILQHGEEEDIDLLKLAMTIAEEHDTFFEVDFEQIEQYIQVQRRVYEIERKLEIAKSKPPPVISFGMLSKPKTKKTKRKKRKFHQGQDMGNGDNSFKSAY